MALAAEKLGPESFQESTRKAGQIHFWYSEGTRPYMAARAALAYLLWRKLGKLQDAIAQFQELLRLNPGDNQGNRHALLCCLLEAGDDVALGEALEQHRTYDEETVEPMEITDTCWWYCSACWLYRCSARDSNREPSREASKALRTAFKYNQHVPRFLLHPTELKNLDDLGHYAPGDIYEAAWFVEFSLKGWQQTQGALEWLEKAARRAKIVL